MINKVIKKFVKYRRNKVIVDELKKHGFRESLKMQEVGHFIDHYNNKGFEYHYFNPMKSRNPYHKYQDFIPFAVDEFNPDKIIGYIGEKSYVGNNLEQFDKGKLVRLLQNSDIKVHRGSFLLRKEISLIPEETRRDVSELIGRYESAVRFCMINNPIVNQSKSVDKYDLYGFDQ